MARRDPHASLLTRAGCKPCALAVLSLGGLLAEPAFAQDAVAGRGLTLGASVDASLSSTAERRGGGVNSSDLVSELRPAFYLNSRSGRVVGSLSYSLVLTHHQKAFAGENVHNQLSANFSVEAVERWAYVDVSATVTQQAASAYGEQSAANSSSDNANRVEVGTLRISPYVRGVLGSAVNYELRLNASGTNGRRSITADSTAVGGGLQLSSAVPGSLVGWGFTANHVKQDFRAGRESTNDRYSGSLSFVPDPDLSLDLRGGQESNDIASLSRATYNNWGAGLTWRPSPRTRAQFQFDERYFGRSHQVTIEHRLASTSFQFTSSRDAGSSADPSNTGSQPITIYQALDRLLAAQYPDPVERDARVRALLGNVDPGQLVGGGAISSAVTVTTRHQLMASYGNARLSGSLQIFATSNRAADPASSVDAFKQWGYMANASYRLSPTATISALGSRLLTQGTDTRAGTELKSATLSWSDLIARRTTASLSVRYSVFNSTTDPYREGAISASLNQRF